MKTKFYTNSKINADKLEEYGLYQEGDNVYHALEKRKVILIGQAWDGTVDFILEPELKPAEKDDIYVITDVNCGYPDVRLITNLEDALRVFVSTLCSYRNPFGDRARKEVRLIVRKLNN